MPRKILVVEDDKDLTLILQKYLEGQGFQVRTAGDGLEALERLKEGIPDLILLDLMMPRMDGYAFNMKLKENPLTAKIPVVVLTGYAHVKEFHEMAKDVTISAYLEKPIPLNVVGATIERVLNAAPSQEA